MEIDINCLVKEYGNMISMIAHRMIQNKEIAREAAQEVWYELCKSISSFKGDSEISTWIYTIARRTIGRYAACEKQVKMSEIEYFRSLPEFEYSGGEEAKREWIKERCDWCITALNHCVAVRRPPGGRGRRQAPRHAHLALAPFRARPLRNGRGRQRHSPRLRGHREPVRVRPDAGGRRDGGKGLRRPCGGAAGGAAPDPFRYLRQPAGGGFHSKRWHFLLNQ